MVAVTVIDTETGEIIDDAPPPAAYADCGRCGGSGVFLGRTGKVLGKCFACGDRRKREERLAALPPAPPTPTRPVGWRPVCERCQDIGDYVVAGHVVGPCYACAARAQRSLDRAADYEAHQEAARQSAAAPTVTPPQPKRAPRVCEPWVEITAAGAVVCTYTKPRSRTSYGSTRWVLGGPEDAVRQHVNHLLDTHDARLYRRHVEIEPREIIDGWWRAVVWKSDHVD